VWCGKRPQASMTALLQYYTRMLELVKRQGPEGQAVTRDAVSIPAIMYEIRRLLWKCRPGRRHPSSVSCVFYFLSREVHSLTRDLSLHRFDVEPDQPAQKALTIWCTITGNQHHWIDIVTLPSWEEGRIRRFTILADTILFTRRCSIPNLFEVCKRKIVL